MEKTENKKTIKADNVISAYRILNNAKLGKMEDAEKFALIKAVRQLKKVGTDFDDFLKDAQEKLKPENFEAIAGKVQNKEELTPEEAAKLNKYNADVTTCVKDELDKDVELTFAPLSEEAIGRLIASNDFAVAEILTVTDVIGA